MVNFNNAIHPNSINPHIAVGLNENSKIVWNLMALHFSVVKCHRSLNGQPFLTIDQDIRCTWHLKLPQQSIELMGANGSLI